MRPAGKLDRRIRFERRAKREDNYGNFVDEWQRFGTMRYASLLPTRGSEAVVAARLEGQVSYDLWVRRDTLTASVTTDDRVVDEDGQPYAIKFIGDMTGKREWLLMQLATGEVDGRRD